MYEAKRYKLINIKKQGETTLESELAHENMLNSTCVFLDLKIGERAWFACKMTVDPEAWHRIHTSKVLSVLEGKSETDKQILIIETENSMYTAEEL